MSSRRPFCSRSWSSRSSRWASLFISSRPQRGSDAGQLPQHLLVLLHPDPLGQPAEKELHRRLFTVVAQGADGLVVHFLESALARRNTRQGLEEGPTFRRGDRPAE